MGISHRKYVDSDQDGDLETVEVWSFLRDKDGTMPFLKSNASAWFEYGFGWLYRAYEGGYWFWELIEFLRSSSCRQLSSLWYLAPLCRSLSVLSYAPYFCFFSAHSSRMRGTVMISSSHLL